MPSSITVYSLAELRDLFPESYAAVLGRWRKAAEDDPEVAWEREIFASLKATIKACGGSLLNWSIGAYSRSYVRIGGIGEAAGKAEFGEILRELGYWGSGKDAPEFPGHCKLTGYCFDDDCLESVWQSVHRGNSLQVALEGLADLMRRQLEAEHEYRIGEGAEEDMEANWGESQFTESGKMI